MRLSCTRARKGVKLVSVEVQINGKFVKKVKGPGSARLDAVLHAAAVVD